ncbi:hypothetical protein BDF14DRAFT_503875, partial [Spinellus fusiger]
LSSLPYFIKNVNKDNESRAHRTPFVWLTKITENFLSLIQTRYIYLYTYTYTYITLTPFISSTNPHKSTSLLKERKKRKIKVLDSLWTLEKKPLIESFPHGRKQFIQDYARMIYFLRPTPHHNKGSEKTFLMDLSLLPKPVGTVREKSSLYPVRSTSSGSSGSSVHSVHSVSSVSSVNSVNSSSSTRSTRSTSSTHTAHTTPPPTHIPSHSVNCSLDCSLNCSVNFSVDCSLDCSVDYSIAHCMDTQHHQEPHPLNHRKRKSVCTTIDSLVLPASKKAMIATDPLAESKHISGTQTTTVQPHTSRSLPKREKVDTVILFDTIDIDTDDASYFSPLWVPQPEVLDCATVKVVWKGGPLTIDHQPYYSRLHSTEATIASTLRLSPVQYLRCKRVLICGAKEYAENNMAFRKSDAQKLCRVDVNKTSALWKVFGQLGWMGRRWPN